MSGQDKEKRLDGLISRAIDSGKVEFDAEKWKQKYPEEFGLLASRTKTGSAGQVNIWRLIYKSPVTKFAVAAAIMVAFCLFLTHHSPNGQIETPQIAQTADSPAEFTTLVSLNTAFRDGGIEAVEKQLSRAFKMLGPRPDNLTVRDLYAELNS